MQLPEFWRGPDEKLYRIRRERRRLAEGRGYEYTVRAFALGGAAGPAAEASVALREAELLEMVRLNQQVPTPEQLYLEAFQALTARLARLTDATPADGSAGRSTS
jgi:hypothetical protein